MTDYIPRKDSELLLWGANFVEQVALYAGKWGIDADTVSALQAAYAKFKLSVAITDSPAKNKVNVAEKNDDRDNFIKLVRALAGFQLKNPVITDPQRIALGLHVHDSTYTPVPVPAKAPRLVVKSYNERQLTIEYLNTDGDSKARPYGVNGVVIVYGVLDTPPAIQEDLPRNVLATHTPFVLDFVETDRGKTVYISICWQNEKGQKGPWSNIEKTIVP